MVSVVGVEEVVLEEPRLLAGEARECQVVVARECQVAVVDP